MKINANTVLIVGAIAAGVFIATRVSRAAEDALQAVNPLNNDNVISQGFNELIGATDKGTSLGSIIFDFFNPEFDPNAPTDRQVLSNPGSKPQPIQGPTE